MSGPNRLFGTWLPVADATQIAYNVFSTRGRTRVVLFSTETQRDEYKVSPLHWDGHRLNFVVRAPDASWHVGVSLAPVSKNRAVAAITTTEVMERIRVHSGHHADMSHGNADPFVGRWKLCSQVSASSETSASQETCSSSAVIEIGISRGRYQIRAYDSEEMFAVRNVIEEGRSLRFQTTVRSNKWRADYRLEPRSRNTLVCRLTFYERLRRQRRADRGTAPDLIRN